MAETSDDRIAIVGIGCKVPGAENIREFWRVLLQGENHVVEIPPARWNADAFFDPDPLAPGKTHVKWAGLVSGSDEFDNRVYGINDFEVAQMDPQQRFVLDCTLMALEDAGLTRAQMAGSNTGVFLGAMNSDYRGLFTAHSSNVGNYTVTGISNSIISARVSYVFDLRGPSLVLDTACSSSLIGIHLGCQAIRAGDCDMAIAGGTNYLTLPDVFVHLSKAGMISPTGQCHSFSNKADGYTRGEGCGIVILKRLRDAERDGDNIWATIYTGSNQDGHSVSPITAPSGLQQMCLLDSVIQKAGLDLSRIDYIEAHGTGTNAGDPVEANSLGEFFKTRAAPRHRYVGSVKTNIGHLESAAGVVGAIKVLLMMKHCVIVPSLHCDEANPKINFTELMLTVPGKVIPWDNPDKVSCCNSFGFGGSNSHAVLCHYRHEQGKRDAIVTKQQTQRPCIVCFSACTEKSLRAIMEDVYTEPGITKRNIHDVSYTSTARRDHYPIRIARIVEDIQDLMTTLEEDIARSEFPPAVNRKPKVTFVFCGMATAWAGMCQELMLELPVFRQAIMQVEQHLKSYVQWSLSERLLDATHFNEAEFSPLAIFACQVALTAVWRDLGITPYSIVGQSVGEVAAAWAAGCLSLEDAVKIVYHRSHLLATVTGGEMMIVRNASVEKIRQVMNKYADKASISLQYSPVSCCISTSQDVAAQVRADLESALRAGNKGMQLLTLDVPVAYHSHYVDPCVRPLAAALEGLVAHPPVTPFVSSVTGERITTAPGVAYWVDNLRKPVLFDQAVSQARDPKHKPLFLEIGPKPVLRAHLPDIFPHGDMPCVMSMSKPPEYYSFLQALTALYGHGLDLRWKNLPSLGTQVTSIPRYVFDKKKILAKTETATLLLSGVDENHKIHPYAYPLQTSAGFKLIITPLGFKSVYDHVISGKVVVPGAFYAEAGFAIAKHFNSCSSRKFAVSVDFEQALSVPKDGIMEIDVHFAESFNSGDRWRAPIRVMRENRLLAVIRITEIVSDQSPAEVVSLDHIRSRCPEEFSKDAIYKALRSAGFFYGETFCLLEHAVKNGRECLATLKVHKNVIDEMPGTTIHPSILDCMLQSSLVVTADGGGDQKDLLPNSLGRVMVHRPMEPVMYVHARIRIRGTKQNFYDLRLLSTSGCIIAELDGLVINLIMEKQEDTLSDMFTMVWSPVMPLASLNATSESKHIVYLSDQALDQTGFREERVVLPIAGLDFTKGLPRSIHQTIVTNKKAAAIVLLCFQPVPDTIDSDSLDQHIINLSFLYKEILQVANELLLSVPIYLCTRNAWPSTSANFLDQQINPASTGLWGLCRTVLRERIYPSIVTVEFQLPSGDLTMSFIQRTFDLLLTNRELQDHPELMVTSEGIHVNHITIVDPETPIPMFRSNLVNREKSAVLLSSESSALVRSIAVLHDVTSVSDKSKQDTVLINAHAFALQCPSLLKLKMQYERFERSKPSKANGYTVFAVEVVGNGSQPTTGNGGTANRVVACYPVAVGTQVSVPIAATLSAEDLPGYELGDLTKLVVMFELHRKVKTPRVTILASSRTRHYAGLLQQLFVGIKCGKIPYTTNVVMTDQLEKANNNPLNETIISLVLLDGSIMSTLTSRWNNASCLITCSCLLDSEALSCIYYFAQDLDVCLVDTQLLFQPACLKKLIPEVGKWAKKQNSFMPKVMSALHGDMSATTLPSGADWSVVVDLGDLLRFRKSAMTNVEVQVSKDELFRKDSCYIVVGGLSGLGWICVNYLVEKGAGYVAIFNRSSPSSEQFVNIRNLAKVNACHVQAFQVDVTSVQSLKNAFQQIQEVFPTCQLKGIFFGAAVTEDKSFLSMDISTFDKALAPKVKGVWNLHNLTKNMNLDYFVMHSSVTSVVGNGGQSNYAVGNAFMDGMAHYRRQKGLAAQAVNWGALDTGMLDNNSMARQVLESQGFLFLSPEEIKHILTSILMLNWPQCAPIKFDRERLTQRMTRDAILPLRNRLKKILVNASQEAEIEEDLLHEVQAAKNYTPERRLMIYESYVKKLVSKVLSVDANSITPDVSLLDLGLDSIVSMTMINQIHRDTSRRLPAVAFVTGEPTIMSIAEAMDEISEDGTDESEHNNQGKEAVDDESQEPYVEASTIESHQLAIYKQHPRRESLHGFVDISLQKHQADQENIQKAIISVLARQPSARAVFTEENGPSNRRFRRSTLTTDKSFDLRVIEEDVVLGDKLESSHSSEAFDVHKSGPVRFILVHGPEPRLRLVFHKAAFDYRSASLLVSDLTSCLDSRDGLPVSPSLALDTLAASKLNQRLEALYKDKQTEIVEFWQSKLQDDIRPISLAFDSSICSSAKSEIGSVKLVVPLSLVQLLKDFVTFHDVHLLGVIGSCYQLLLHILSGEMTIPLVFPVDLRKMGFDINNDMANHSNEIPLIAHFGPERLNTRSMSLQNFVLTNNRNMLQDIKHGVLPLSMFESLSQKAQSVFSLCSHGIGIEILASPQTNGCVEHNAASGETECRKAKDALKLKTSHGTAIMPGDLETNLLIEHLLEQRIITLSLSYKRSLLDRARADCMLKMLVFVILRLLTHPNTSIDKMTRRGRKIMRKLAERSRKISQS